MFYRKLFCGRKPLAAFDPAASFAKRKWRDKLGILLKFMADKSVGGNYSTEISENGGRRNGGG